MADINTPDFDFSGLYYPQILEDLMRYKRLNVPEISTESPLDAYIQLIRMMALASHLNTTLLDLVALEVYGPTGQIRGNVVRAFAPIGYQPKADIPATTILLARLVRSFDFTVTVVPALALFSTRRLGNAEPVLFEAQEALTLTRTDEVDACWEHDPDLDVWTDYTGFANSDAADPVTLVTVAGRALYFGHAGVFPNTWRFEGITSFDLGDKTSGAAAAVHYQFYDGEIEDATPTSVTLGATTMTFVCTTLLGTESQVGNHVWVTLNRTGARQRAAVEFTGGVNVVTINGFLGQTSPSSLASDYTIGTYWHDLELATNTTEDVIPVTGEVFAVSTGVETGFVAVVAHWPLEPNTLVTWTYTSGGSPRTATLLLTTGTRGGDAGPGTTGLTATGQLTLFPLSLADAGNITVSYSRAAQPFQQDGEITFLPPFTVSDRIRSDYLPSELRGADGPTVKAYWFRVLISAVTTDAQDDLIFERLILDAGRLYVQIPVTQGQTRIETLGSGTGAPFQEFTLRSFPVIEASVELEVDGEPWHQVDSFFASTAFDDHFIVEIDDEGVATIKTGDGSNGRAVPIGVDNVTTVYRTDADIDGNVGAGMIVVSRSGLGSVQSITNPQPARGWARQEGADPIALEVMKRDAAAYLRTLRRAVSPSDTVYLATRWVSPTTNSKPFVRCRAIENGFGRKTIKLIVVASGGDASSVEDRNALDTYFNGDLASGGVEPGIGLMNREITSVDYTPRTFTYQATITGGNETIIRAFLLTALTPESKRADGINWRWEFGQTLDVTILAALIKEADPTVTGITLAAPAATINLEDDELPNLSETNFSLTFT